MSNESLMSIWIWYLLVTFILNAIIIVWVAIGGICDLRHFFRELKAAVVDDTDDGRVTDSYTLDTSNDELPTNN